MTNTGKMVSRAQRNAFVSLPAKQGIDARRLLLLSPLPPRSTHLAVLLVHGVVERALRTRPHAGHNDCALLVTSLHHLRRAHRALLEEAVDLLLGSDVMPQSNTTLPRLQHDAHIYMEHDNQPYQQQQRDDRFRPSRVESRTPRSGP